MRGGGGEKERKREEVLSTVGSLNMLVARKMKGARRKLLGASDSMKRGTSVPRRVLTMRISTIGDPRENEPMTRAEEGGEHGRHALSRHNLNGGSRFWGIFSFGVFTCGQEKLSAWH